jgi:rhodanese-related sulfurtransferase
VPADGAAREYCSLDGTECKWSGATAPELSDPEFISLAEVKAMKASDAPVIVVDARTERTYSESNEQIPGAVRVSPEQSVASAGRAGIPKAAVLAVLCA